MINNISNNKKHVKKVLSYLFPKFAYSFNNNYYDYKNRKFRIGSDIHFDKYFTLSISTPISSRHSRIAASSALSSKSTKPPGTA